jgi:hypothetical protein
MTLRLIAGLAAFSALAACQTPADPVTPMVGGPCRYEFTSITATVMRVLDDEIEFAEEDHSRFWIAASDFNEPPEPGQRYNFEKRYIVEGTCTPYGYQLAGPAEN